MSSPAPLSAPESRFAPLSSPPSRAGAAALLLALSLAPAAARAGCTTREVGTAAESCNRGDDRVACQASLQSLWFDCQEAEREKDKPYPRITSDDQGVTHANLGGVVFALRNMYGLPTFPEAKARADGTERNVAYWGQERFEGENDLYVRARGRRLSEEDATTWLAEQLRRRGAPASDTTSDDGETPPTRTAVSPPRRRTDLQGGTDGRRDELQGGPGFRAEGNAPVVPPSDLSRAQLMGGDHRGAAATADKMLAADPEDVGALEMRARARMLSGDRDGAFADARRILKLDPKNKDARAILGGADAVAHSADRFGRMKVGMEGMREDAGGPAGAGRGEESGGGGRDGRNGLGGVRDEFAAPAALLEGTPADPKAAQLRELWTSAQRYANMGDWANALREASRLVSLNPEDPEAWLLRSKISAKMGNWEAAEADARRALALKPDDPAALLILGRALVQQGKVVDGLAVIERALALQPRNALAHYYRGEALEKLGRKGEAIDAYNLALQLDPGLGPLVEEALARLNPNMAVPQGGRGAPMPPAKRWFRLAVAALGSLFLLKGLHFLVGGRLRTSFTAKPETTTRPPLREEDQHAGALGRDPIAGDVIGGNFKVERELARGGMGVVYLATDVVLRRLVAIKRLHWEHMRTEETRRKFLQEAQLAARLKHPNLAQIHSVFGERELYLVFELVEGQTLDALLTAKGRLGLPEVRAIVGQVCRALEHAHGHRVIHRDLKPANIMLARDGTCKVMDFGIAHEARTASGATQTQAWGTPPYMAPEQEEGYVSPASDLYALAVVAYELLAGRRPFDGPSQHAAKRTAGFKRIGGQDGLPAELDRFFERALHPEAALRYTTAADFRAAFEELAGTPVGR